MPMIFTPASGSSLEGVSEIELWMTDYAMVNFDVFARVVDLFGGVDFDVPVDMDYEDPYQDLYIHLKAGEQHLNGEEALQVMRFRSGYAMADLERVNVQRNFVQAAMDQWLNWTVMQQ